MRFLKVKVAYSLLLIFHASVSFAQPVEWANGYWALDDSLVSDEMYQQFNCERTPIHIQTNEKQKSYKSQHFGENIIKGSILLNREKYIVIQYEGDKGFDEKNEPIRWMMVFVNPDQFFWTTEVRLRNKQLPSPNHVRKRCKMKNEN